MAVQPSHRRSAWRRRAERWGCQLPSTVVRGPLPGKQPRPMSEPRTSTCSPARACRPDRPRSSRRCSMKALCAERTGCWPRAGRGGQSAQSSLLHQARAGGHGPQPDLAWDITRLRGRKNAGPPSTSMSWTSSAVASWAGWLPTGERRARRDADRGNLSQARHRAPGAHPAFGPRRVDDQQVHRPSPRRPGVTRSLSRPQVSDDNPFSEAQFKTLTLCAPRLPSLGHYRRHRASAGQSSWPGYNTWTDAGLARMLTTMMSIITSTGCSSQRGRTVHAAWALTLDTSIQAETRPASRRSGSDSLPQQERRVSIPFVRCLALPGSASLFRMGIDNPGCCNEWPTTHHEKAGRWPELAILVSARTVD